MACHFEFTPDKDYQTGKLPSDSDSSLYYHLMGKLINILVYMCFPIESFS